MSFKFQQTVMTPNGPGYFIGIVADDDGKPGDTVLVSHNPKTQPVSEAVKRVWLGGPCVFLTYNISEVTDAAR
jgi:hypothetical protein